MGDIIELIKSRRTIKSYLPKFVSWENISKIVDAGRHAPSSGNLQNWKFIVFFEPAKKAALAELAYEQYDLTNAGALIVICSETEKVERYYGLRGERLYSIQNCAAAAQNMLLEAHSLGLGGSWIGAFDEDGVKSLCNIPENVRAQAIIAIGYPKDIPQKPPKYPLETVTYFHGWRKKERDPAKYMMDIASILARKAHSASEKLKGHGKFIVNKAQEKLQPSEESKEEK